MKVTQICLWLAASVTPLAAVAQDEDVLLSTIIVSQPKNSSLEEDGIDVTSEGIALSNPADLSELFVAEPTISVGSSIPMSQKVYVNGIEENNLAISIDGARQNNKIFHHNTTTLIDPALLKAVRVDPGVASADAGPGALAGALAYETKDAADLLEPGDTFGGQYKLEYETNGDIFSNSLSLFGAQDGFEYLAFLKYADGDLREDGNGDELIGTATNVISGLAKVAYQTDSGSRFELSFDRVNDDESRPYRANIGAIVGGRPVPETRPYDLERTNVVFTYTEASPDGWWDPTIRLAYSTTELFNDESDLSTQQTIFGETSSVNGEISNRFGLDWGSINAGVDFFSDRADIDYRSLEDASFNEEAEEKLDNIGIFAQARMTLSNEARLSFGLRADFQHFEGVDRSSQRENGLSGNIAGEYDLTDNLRISAGYSNVWGGIELAENYILNPAWSYAGDKIEEVTSENFYLAARYDVGDWVLDGKLFKTEITDARAPNYRVGPSETVDLDSQGFEIGVTTYWDGGFFRAGFASIDTELDGRTADSFTGNYLTMPMGDFLTFQAAHQFDNGLLVGGDAQVAFDYDDTYDFDTGGKGPELPGYTVVNAFVEYVPSQLSNLTLRAEVNNLFDQQYAARATYGQEFVGEVVPLYEPGRSFRLSAVMTF
ncbi:MAG: TonB-dependent receptor [Pseudomonadota bacterium]